jgi:hypothetical protein
MAVLVTSRCVPAATGAAVTAATAVAAGAGIVAAAAAAAHSALLMTQFVIQSSVLCSDACGDSTYAAFTLCPEHRADCTLQQ